MSPHGQSMCCVLALVGMQVSLVLPVPLCSSKVGVAVDLDSRQILFGTNGVWAPAYGEEALAVGTIVIICRSLATNAKQSNLTLVEVLFHYCSTQSLLGSLEIARISPLVSLSTRPCPSTARPPSFLVTCLKLSASCVSLEPLEPKGLGLEGCQHASTLPARRATLTQKGVLEQLSRFEPRTPSTASSKLRLCMFPRTWEGTRPKPGT